MFKLRSKKYFLLFFCLVVLSQLETACDSGGPAFKEQASTPGDIHYYGEQAESDKRGPGSPADRKVIVSHNLTVEVGELGLAFEQAVTLAMDNGGYTTSTSRFRATDGSFQGRISMRVPSSKADATLSGLRKLGTVTAEHSTGEDITEQYVDLEARLDNARASEKRLARMMEKRTTNLADVLAVERELTRVRGDIESMMAKKRNWGTLTRMVSITVELREPPRAMPSAHKIWRPIKTAFGEAAEGFAQSLHYAIVFVGAVIPWLVVLGILAYIALRIFRKRKPQ